MTVTRRARALALLLPVLLVAAAGWALAHKPLAPPVTFTTLTGQRIALQQMKGKLVLVNFWATSCPPCIAEMPRLVQFYRQNQARGFELVSVAMREDRPDHVLDYYNTHHLPFPVALDVEGQIAHAFNTQVTPTAFLIGRDGRILQRYTGAPDFHQLQALLNRSHAPT